MTSKESDLRPSSSSGLKDFYCHLRATFDWSGIFTIAIEAVVLGVAFGSGAALLLITVASLVSAASFLRNTRATNARSKVNEKIEPRTWRNAFANAGVATGFGILSLLIASPQLHAVFAVASVASLAASLSDSLSHEIGMLFGGEPRLITTWCRVEAGENGGVSLVGSVVGAFSAFGLAGLAVFVGVIGNRSALVAALSACFGNIMDSVLGATIERKGWIGNEGVNFGAVLSSGIFVLVAFLVANLVQR